MSAHNLMTPPSVPSLTVHDNFNITHVAYGGTVLHKQTAVNIDIILLTPQL